MSSALPDDSTIRIPLLSTLRISMAAEGSSLVVSAEQAPNKRSPQSETSAQMPLLLLVLDQLKLDHVQPRCCTLVEKPRAHHARRAAPANGKVEGRRAMRPGLTREKSWTARRPASQG